MEGEFPLGHSVTFLSHDLLFVLFCYSTFSLQSGKRKSLNDFVTQLQAGALESVLSDRIYYTLIIPSWNLSQKFSAA